MPRSHIKCRTAIVNEEEGMGLQMRLEIGITKVAPLRPSLLRGMNVPPTLACSTGVALAELCLLAALHDG